ncbi:MAG: GrpB family protein, partial [Mycobacterium sp.]|nr:GrpB family protein [Mycobacterium sp.]
VEPPHRVTPADATWAAQAGRIVSRVKTACGAKALRVDHVGATAVPGLAARDVIDIQVTVESLAAADEVAEALLAAGYPRIDDVAGDDVISDARSTVERFDHSDERGLWHKRVHASADPGRPTNVALRVDGWPNQQYALLVVDWLVANRDVRDEYQTASDADTEERWLRDAYRRAWQWADRIGWRP